MNVFGIGRVIQVLAMLAGITICIWVTAPAYYDYKQAPNIAAKHRWHPATVAVLSSNKTSLLHKTSSGYQTLVVYNLLVRTGPLAGKKLKNIPLVGDMGVGSQFPLWIDSSGNVSDSNGYKYSLFSLRCKTAVVSFLTAIGAIIAMLLLYHNVVKRIGKRLSLARA